MEQARIERTAVLPTDANGAWKRVVDGFAHWFGPDASLEPRLGGPVSCGGRVGHVTTLEELSRICWEWSRDGDPGWTAVEIAFVEDGDRTQVEIVETLHAWEHEQYEATGVSKPGPFGVLAVAG